MDSPIARNSTPTHSIASVPSQYNFAQLIAAAVHIPAEALFNTLFKLTSANPLDPVDQ
jgi:hypothetical protein